MIRKVVVLGPESSGKSTLCQQLADYYQTSWCPEFAREYLKESRGQYTFEDLLNIAQGQLELEDTLLADARNGFYFIDTDMYVMKVWCEVVFERCHTWILQQIAKREYDFYFLCQPDLPWVKDELREYPDPNIRKKLYTMYKDILINSGGPWSEVSGADTQRFQMAVGVLNAVFLRK